MARNDEQIRAGLDRRENEEWHRMVDVLRDEELEASKFLLQNSRKRKRTWYGRKDDERDGRDAEEPAPAASRKSATPG